MPVKINTATKARSQKKDTQFHTFLFPPLFSSSTHPPVRLRRRGPGAPGVRTQVVCVLGGLVLGDEVPDDLPRLVELEEVLRERRSLLVPLHEGVAFPHAVVLLDYPLEELLLRQCQEEEKVDFRSQGKILPWLCSCGSRA